MYVLVDTHVSISVCIKLSMLSDAIGNSLNLRAQYEQVVQERQTKIHTHIVMYMHIYLRRVYAVKHADIAIS